MKCEYCGTDKQGGENCAKCGATLPTMNNRMSHPFLYNGYMVYVGRDFMRDILSAHFWQGERLIETIEVPENALHEFIKEGDDFMPFFYELLKVSRGENEVLTVKALNDRRAARFEIRRIEEHPVDVEYYRSIFERVNA